MEILILAVIAGFLGPIVGIAFAYMREKRRQDNILPPSSSQKVVGSVYTPSVVVRTHLSSHRILDDPRFYNLSTQVFHKNRDCLAFSERDEWEAVTEQEAVSRGLQQCPICAQPIAFVYSRARVYHTSTWCSYATTDPMQLFEKDAIAMGLRKCKACQKRDGS